jgi:hypothetical protein
VYADAAYAAAYLAAALVGAPFALGVCPANRVAAWAGGNHGTGTGGCGCESGCQEAPAADEAVGSVGDVGAVVVSAGRAACQ